MGLSVGVHFGLEVLRLFFRYCLSRAHITAKSFALKLFLSAVSCINYIIFIFEGKSGSRCQA